MDIHFIDIGCGNMVLIRTSTKIIFYDCNITDDNEGRVLRYLRRVLGLGSPIDIFICSHRDADHMRGIKSLHSGYPISTVFDNGVTGTSPDSDEYQAYMELRRRVGYQEIEPQTYEKYGDTKFRFINSKRLDYSNPNEQSIVLKLEHDGGISCLLAGDTNYRPWKEKILPHYGQDVKSNIFLAPHHGSLTFFDDPSDSENYYTKHIKTIAPDMTLISVGTNVHGLPDKKALELYTKYSTGSKQGNRVYSTQEKGNMRLELKDNGEWELHVYQ